MPDRRAILILGMHRSGTSALTRVLNLCGAALPDDVLPPNFANETGYWEPAAIVNLHDELLKASGSAWDDPLAFPVAWFDSPEGRAYVARLAQEIAQTFGAAPLFAVKDPRACRLVPLWLRTLESMAIEPLVVLLVRHPREVAASLGRRDGMAEASALMLWLQHVLAAERDTRGCRRVVVTYEQLLDGPADVIDRIERHLGVVLPEPHGPDSPAAEAIRSFLQPSLRHSRLGREDLDDAAITSAIGVTYDWALKAAAALPIDAAVLDRVRDELTQAERTMAPLLRAQWQIVRERDAAARGLQATIDQRDARVAALEIDRQALIARHEEERVAWLARERDLEDQVRQLGSRCLEVESARDDSWRRACELHDAMKAMERSPFWKARTWIRRQQSRLTGSKRM